MFAFGTVLSLPMQSHALTVVIANGADQIYLRVGRAGGAVSQVAFAVTGAIAGDGTPIVGTVANNAGAAEPPTFPVACPANNVRIVARARSAVANTRTASLRVNSSGGLVSGADTIPFTDFDWTSTDGEIPAGAFNGSPTQLLYTFQNSREVSVCHSLRFLNTTVYPSGTYNGTLTYNLQMP